MEILRNSQQDLALGCQLLLYLDQRRFLYEMKCECELFLERLNENNIYKFPPLRFLLQIDVIELIDFSPELGDFLTKEPLKWQRICTKILVATMKSVNFSDKHVEPAQLAVAIRLKNIPSELFRPNLGYYGPLVIFQGILMAITKPVSYVYQTVWCCPEECEGNEVILHQIPKVLPKCGICRSSQFENSGLRRCGDQVTATFKLKDAILPKNFHIVDDLVSKLKIGLRYNVTASVTKKTISVLSLEEAVPHPAPMTSCVSPDIQELFQLCNGSPWKFIYCLASSIGRNVCPLHCFMHLKISLLLSLSSVKASEIADSKILHVLVAGYDTGYVGNIFKDAAQLATRSVFLGTTNTKASTALIGSSGGICVMQLPLHIYNQKLVSQIFSAIECEELLTETDKAKLQSAVWAQGMDFKKILLSNVANVFGYICRGDLGELGDEVAEFHLQNAVEPSETNKEELQSIKDLRLYLDHVAGIEVSLDDLTEQILTRYFLSARRERPKGLSAGNMASLILICLTSARLCRRKLTNIDDAVFAIWLHISGTPDPRFAPDEYFQTPADIKKLHKMMCEFKSWLADFTGTML